MKNEIGYKHKLITNNFTVTKINSGYLIISSDGSFIFLNPVDFALFINGDINSDLYEKLESVNILITKNTRHQIIENYKKKFNHIFEDVSNHQIIINYESQTISKDNAKKIVEFIFQSPSNNLLIEFIGSEPLNNFDEIKYIVDYSKSLNKNSKKELKFCIYASLKFFSKTIINFLISEKFDVKVRLDGSSEVHKYNSFYNECWNDYDDTIKKIKLLKNSVLLLEAYPIITRKSLFEYKKIIDEYLRLGFNKIELKPLLSLDYSDSGVREKFFTDEEFFDLYKKCVQYIVDNELDIIEVSTQNALLTLLQRKNKGLFNIIAPTKEAINNMAYDFDGAVYPSYDAFKVNKEIFYLGNTTQNYYEIINSKQFKSFFTSSVNMMHLCSHNAFNPYFGLSPVASYANHKSIAPIIPLDFWYKLTNRIYEFIFEKLHYDKAYKAKFEEWLKA